MTNTQGVGGRRLTPRGSGSLKAQAGIAEHRRGLVERAEAEARADEKARLDEEAAAKQRRVAEEAADRRRAEQKISERRQVLARDLWAAAAPFAAAPDHALLRYGEIDYTQEDAKLALAWSERQKPRLRKWGCRQLHLVAGTGRKSGSSRPA